MDTQKPQILCLDDEVDNLEALERLFRKKYIVLKASSAEQAFKILDDSPEISVIITDQRMPIMTGTEFLEKTVLTHSDTPRVLLTGYTDIESVISAVNKGQIFRYHTKPWDAIDLINTVDQASEKFRLKKELKQKNKELEKALTELQTLDKAKNQFMILINHELKTPLTTILSFAELLSETPLSEEQQLFIDRISKSSDKLKKIVEDVLLIVKGEMNLLPVKKIKVSPDWFFAGMPPEISSSLSAKNQELKLSSKLDSFELDAELTAKALYRAIHNATKFGLINSTIDVKISKDLANSLIIEISNEGPTISRLLIEKIMKPFLLDENIMNHSVGMGLGLSICSALLKSQNAQLEVVNRDSGVSVFFKFS